VVGSPSENRVPPRTLIIVLKRLEIILSFDVVSAEKIGICLIKAYFSNSRRYKCWKTTLYKSDESR